MKIERDGVTNRLINEKSPYLLQHAHNPVNWYPWGEEAFSKAISEDKAIFLSIGYSTCHWCHVMERESFEDKEVAQLLNEKFISIKVDREERPDIDHIYMDFCQMMTGSGGWPLTVFLNPQDKSPFFAGTYFPKEDRYGYVGLMTLLQQIDGTWKNKREKIHAVTKEVVQELRRTPEEFGEGMLNDKTIKSTYETLKSYFEKSYGGFGYAPKFPTPHNLTFLLRYYKLTGEKDALEMVTKTLDSMYNGGIFDHIGFGFSRYSTDEKWLVPHFEKMLYDNALLLIAYVEAYQITKKPKYREVTEKIAEYVMRDMTSEEGGFYSAEDADSEGVEGRFYVFDKKEIEQILSSEEAELFCTHYNITERGNFEGKNILNTIDNYTDIGQTMNKQLDECRQKIFEYRKARVHPFKDDKILTSWNGLMIAAMAIAGKVLDNNNYIKAATKAINFITLRLVNSEGRLLARYREGEASNLAFLDDYTFFIWGLLECYEATFNVEYLKRAVKLNGDMLKYFWDEQHGGLFMYGNDSEELIIRPKDVYDGAIPSGNSVAAMNMLRISRMIGDENLDRIVSKHFSTFGGMVKNNPNQYTFFMMSFMHTNSSAKEIVIAGKRDADETQEMIKFINSKYSPFKTVVLNDGNEELHKLIPFIRDQTIDDDTPLVYICENSTCNTPMTQINDLAVVLER